MRLLKTSFARSVCMYAWLHVWLYSYAPMVRMHYCMYSVAAVEIATSLSVKWASH